MNLFVCNTPYQILVSYSIIHRLHKNEENIFVCSNIMNNSEKIVKNMNEFNKTYLVNLDLKKETKIKRFLDRFFYKNSISKYNIDDIFKNKIDNMYISNLTNFNFILFKRLKNKNKNINLNLFEDGMISYSDKYEKTIYDTRIPWYKYISELYFFDPSNIDWKRNNMKTNTILPIDVGDAEFIEKLNYIFDYNSVEQYNNFKYIFFEEGFNADGKVVADLYLLNKISDVVGKENIIVKTHPRSKVNRFESAGYYTNDIKYTIPWELICLNSPMDDKVLISVSSQSIFTPTFLLGQKIEAIMLFNLLDDKSGIYIDSARLLEKISVGYNNIHNIKKMDELSKLLKEYNDEENNG